MICNVLFIKLTLNTDSVCINTSSLSQNILIMKKLILFFLFTTFSSQVIFAQIEEGDKTMSQGVNNSLTIELLEAKKKVVDKTWKKFAKDFKGKTKKDKKMDEYFTDNGKLVAIGGGNTVDVYSRSNEAGDNVFMSVWFDVGGEYLNSESHPSKYVEAEKMLMKFAIEVAKEMTLIELDEQEDVLKKMNRNLKKLESLKERYENEIVRAKEAIAKAEQNIETNIKEQEDAQEQIKMQGEVIDAIKKKLSDLD